MKRIYIKLYSLTLSELTMFLKPLTDSFAHCQVPQGEKVIDCACP
jgi:hypothetical protein